MKKHKKKKVFYISSVESFCNILEGFKLSWFEKFHWFQELKKFLRWKKSKKTLSYPISGFNTFTAAIWVMPNFWLLQNYKLILVQGFHKNGFFTNLKKLVWVFLNTNYIFVVSSKKLMSLNKNDQESWQISLGANVLMINLIILFFFRHFFGICVYFVRYRTNVSNISDEFLENEIRQLWTSFFLLVAPWKFSKTHF